MYLHFPDATSGGAIGASLMDGLSSRLATRRGAENDTMRAGEEETNESETTVTVRRYCEMNDI